MVDLRPACLITGTVSPYRREPFRLLSEREAVEVIAFEHAGTRVPGLTVHRVSQAPAPGTVELSEHVIEDQHRITAGGIPPKQFCGGEFQCQGERP